MKVRPKLVTVTYGLKLTVSEELMKFVLFYMIILKVLMIKVYSKKLLYIVIVVLAKTKIILCYRCCIVLFLVQKISSV